MLQSYGVVTVSSAVPAPWSVEVQPVGSGTVQPCVVSVAELPSGETGALLCGWGWSEGPGVGCAGCGAAPSAGALAAGVGATAALLLGPALPLSSAAAPTTVTPTSSRAPARTPTISPVRWRGGCGGR
ncbi:hypothetical protein [Kitasatospora mediocidica]|uniref:hypothetical protein n=1 Tax=Kitasatospora mediocidica TaxID=58352 RepID=UPI0012FAC826|nr:hypothetical protein [Kitasatospora mediocidica]